MPSVPYVVGRSGSVANQLRVDCVSAAPVRGPKSVSDNGRRRCCCPLSANRPTSCARVIACGRRHHVRAPLYWKSQAMLRLRTRLGIELPGAHSVSAFRALSAPGQRVFPRFLTKKSLGMLDASATGRPSLSVIRGVENAKINVAGNPHHSDCSSGSHAPLPSRAHVAAMQRVSREGEPGIKRRCASRLCLCGAQYRCRASLGRR